MLMFLINIGVLIIVWVGGNQVINGDLTVGGIVAFSNYLMTTMVPLLIMAMLANVVASGMALLTPNLYAQPAPTVRAEIATLKAEIASLQTAVANAPTLGREQDASPDIPRRHRI